MLISWVHSTFHLENGPALLFVARRNEIARRHLHIHHGRTYFHFGQFSSPFLGKLLAHFAYHFIIARRTRPRFVGTSQTAFYDDSIYSGCPTENHFKTHSECGNLFLSYKKNLNAEVLHSASYSLKTGFILRII